MGARRSETKADGFFWADFWVLLKVPGFLSKVPGGPSLEARPVLGYIRAGLAWRSPGGLSTITRRSPGRL